MDSFVVLLFSGFLFGGLCAYIASQKGRDWAAWFIGGFFLSFIGLIALAALPSVSRDANNQSQSPYVACEHCGGQNFASANQCRYCKKPIMKDDHTQESSGVAGDRDDKGEEKSIAEQLNMLATLKDKGDLSEEEFARLKSKLLS